MLTIINAKGQATEVKNRLRTFYLKDDIEAVRRKVDG